MEKEYITEKDLADMFGVSLETVRRWRWRDGMPYTKIGRKIIINEAEFLEWFKTKKK